MSPPDDLHRSLSFDEKLERLRALSTEDRSRLYAVAKRLVLPADQFDFEDISSETVAVLLRDTVRWPPHLETMQVLVKKMKGVVSDMRKAADRRIKTIDVPEEFVENTHVESTDGPFEALAVHQLESELKRWAEEDDNQTLEIVLLSKLDGEAKKDVMSSWGYTSQQYDAARRRIQRKLQSLIDQQKLECADE